MLDRLSHF